MGKYIIMVQNLETLYGTVPYCAPELYEWIGYDGPTIDICVFRIVLYFMLTECFP